MTTLAFSGAGSITAVHGMAAKATPDVTVTAVASRTEARAAERAGQLGARACGYDDLPGGADVVFVTSAPAAHALGVMQALQGGAAAIVEKPLATTLTDADRIVAAAEAVGGRVGYAENLAYAPIVRRLLDRRASLGRLAHLDARAIQPAPDWGGFLEATWGGGVLFDLGPHPVALVLLMARPGRPVSVSATLARHEAGEVDDHAEVSITFDTGLVARVEASWRGTGETTVWDLQAAGDTGVLRLELVPTPALEADGEPCPLPAPRGDVPEPRLEQMGYTVQLETMIDDFARGREPLMSAAFGRQVLDVICGAYAAAGAGEPVALPFAGRRDATPLALWRDGA